MSCLERGRATRNHLTIHNAVAYPWWSDEIRWLRTLKNLMLKRLSWIGSLIEGSSKRALDLGCAGGFIARDLATRRVRMTALGSGTRRKQWFNCRYISLTTAELPHDVVARSFRAMQPLIELRPAPPS